MTVPLVDCQQVTFAYGAPAGFTLRDLSFEVRAGETFGVIGPNASGKTTLVRLLSRVLTPAAGRIALDGVDLAALSRAAVARQIAVVPQDVPSGFPHTVEELVLMGRYPRSPRRFFESEEDRAAARRAMESVGVLDLRGALLDRLSGGSASGPCWPGPSPRSRGCSSWTSRPRISICATRPSARASCAAWAATVA